MFFYEVARRTGIDRIAAMSARFGLGTKLDIDLPGARTGLVPTRAWRTGQGKAWNIGDTIVCGIGQGYIQLTPLALATMVARVATGRAVQPHLTRTIGGVLQKGAKAEDWPSLGLPERALHAVRDGMWAVVNDPHGTAPPGQAGDLRGGDGGERPAPSRCAQRDARAAGARGTNPTICAWEMRPHALFGVFRAV